MLWDDAYSVKSRIDSRPPCKEHAYLVIFCYNLVVPTPRGTGGTVEHVIFIREMLGMMHTSFFTPCFASIPLEVLGLALGIYRAIPLEARGLYTNYL